MIEFAALAINEKEHKICMELLNGELAPVINQCAELNKEITHCDFIIGFRELSCNKNEELKKARYNNLYNSFIKAYNALPVSSMSFNGGIEKYINNVEKVKEFVTTFKKEFENYRNNFHNPEIAPQLDA
jgi:hypothetical protein